MLLQLNAHSYSCESERDINKVGFIQAITQLNIRENERNNCLLYLKLLGFCLINFTLRTNTLRHSCGKQIKNVFLKLFSFLFIACEDACPCYSIYIQILFYTVKDAD